MDRNYIAVMRHLFFLFALLFCVGLSPAQNSKKVQSLKKQQTTALQNIKSTNRQIDKTQKTQLQALHRLEALSTEIAHINDSIRVLNAEIAEISAQEKKLTADIAELERTLGIKKESYAKAVRSMSVRRDNRYDALMFVLSASSLEQAYRRFRYLQEFSAWRKQEAKEIVQQRDDLNRQRTELLRIRKEQGLVLALRTAASEQLIRQQREQRTLVAGLRKKERALKQELKKQQQQADAAQHSSAEMQRTLNAARAGILAQDLVDGTPCPVCGALHHPAPAAPAPSHVTEAACNKAAQAAASAAAEASKASTAAGEAKAAAQTQRDTLYARAAAFLAHRRQHYTGPQADALTPDELQTALQAQHDSLRRGLAEVHDRMANAESRKKDLEKLTRQKAQLQAQRPDQANAVEQARTAQANAEKAAAEAQTRLAEGQKNLPWPDAAAMAAARAETQKQRRTLQAALDAAAKSRDAFSKELAAAQSAAQTLAEQAGDTASRPDPAAQQQALTALQAERKNLRDQNQAALHRLDTNRDALTKLKKAITAAESARANAAMLDNLSKTINGNLTQKQKLPFEQYVQSFYFDGVVAAANRRFTRMTGGQYTLRRRQSADIAAKTALELDVFDAYTGKTRPVGSLSGGESFLAALSLALGISDTIQESAGGISVDTLFVDEGFGTLDADALQKAIDTLTALAGSDKLVGIISHVETLQDRIPKQILVQKTKCGSKAQVELG